MSELDTSSTIPSVNRTSEDPVLHVVSRTAERSRYCRTVSRTPSTRMEKEPARSPPTSLPNTGSESNRGTHNQSMEP
jgi:hypothetical protein